MSIANKIANDAHETAGRYTTRSYSRHGLSKRARVFKRVYNRIGKRAESRIAFKDEDMSLLSMLCEVIDHTFMKVCGKHQLSKELSERKAFRVCFSLRLDYEKEEGYRYLEMVIWGPMNYVQVWVRESWDVIPIEDLEDEDDGGPKPGKKYTKGAHPWELVGDHDSGWRDGVKRTVEKFEKRINGFSGDWYKLIDPKLVEDLKP